MAQLLYEYWKGTVLPKRSPTQSPGIAISTEFPKFSISTICVSILEFPYGYNTITIRTWNNNFVTKS